jgi:hypothetical protein
MNIEKKANNLLCIFSEYMDDYMLEEFFTDTNLTKEGRKLFKEIKKELSKKEATRSDLRKAHDLKGSKKLW